MDIWLSILNTSTQGLNDFISQSKPDDRQKKYLIEKFYQLIGSVKLFISLDQSIGFTDNHIIDSGLIRGLFRYSSDSTIRRLKDEFKDTLFSAANKIIYVHDKRVSKDEPESLIRERFELTKKNKDFIYSAAFANEANWSGIENYNDLVNKVPEYKAIFGFLIELLERIPKENIVADPRKEETFSLMLEDHFDVEKDYLQDSPRYAIRTFLKENKGSKSGRSSFYQHLAASLDPETTTAVKTLFADPIYNRISVEVLKNRYTFEEWTILGGTQEFFNKVYRPSKNKESIDKLRISVQRLYQKGKMFNFLASRDLETISKIRDKVRSDLLDETKKSKRKLAKNIMWDLYKSERGDEVNKAYRDTGLDIISSVSDDLSPFKRIKLVVPFLNSAKFFYLTSFNSQYKDLINIMEHALSNEQQL